MKYLILAFALSFISCSKDNRIESEVPEDIDILHGLWIDSASSPLRHFYFDSKRGLHKQAFGAISRLHNATWHAYTLEGSRLYIGGLPSGAPFDIEDRGERFIRLKPVGPATDQRIRLYRLPDGFGFVPRD